MKVIVTAGGTGGHIYPALAIINKIKSLDKKCEILYIGTHNRMEKDIIPSHNIDYIPIEIYGLTKNIPHDIKNIGLIIKAYNKCKRIIKNFKPEKYYEIESSEETNGQVIKLNPKERSKRR